MIQEDTGCIAAALASGPQRVLLVGMGITNRSVAGALIRRRHAVVAVDDHVDDDLRDAAATLGVEVEEAPGVDRLSQLVSSVDLVCPSPGLPEHHPVFAIAHDLGMKVVSEFDLAAAWDQRPIVAITGTNGKTTVVELAVDALRRAGVSAVAAGNNEIPLVAVIDDPNFEVFVVEASSFRLARSHEFRPVVGTWLNFASDHLDIHSDLQSYEAAKAGLFSMIASEGCAVANAADAVVMSHIPADRSVVTFGLPDSDWHRDGDQLVGPDGAFTTVDRLWRDLPHDIEDALAVAASVAPLGAGGEAVAAACEHFGGLAHRIAKVAEIDGSIYYDDSKATTPHATLAALNGFPSAVLIAGGRNKGIDLSALAAGGDRVVAVVAIGEAAEEVSQVFAASHPVAVAQDMEDAVRLARDFADPGVAVLLSPGCASFDWYRSYGERGDDFTRIVEHLASEEDRS